MAEPTMIDGEDAHEALAPNEVRVQCGRCLGFFRLVCETASLLRFWRRTNFRCEPCGTDQEKTMRNRNMQKVAL